jgi:hypothetical protein
MRRVLTLLSLNLIGPNLVFAYAFKDTVNLLVAVGSTVLLLSMGGWSLLDKSPP